MIVVRAGAAPRAAVVGTGLIGGSVLLRLHGAGVDVAGWDPDPATRSYARGRGLRVPETLDEAVAGRDLVFCCGPLPALPDTLLRVAAATPADCVLTDVGSTKGALAAFAEQRDLLDRFVPGHPMAGAESAGLAAATPTLLDSAAWVLCPAAGTGTPAFRRLTGLLVELFGARVVPMTPADHDAAVALASHVPHLLAGALAGAADRAPLRDAVLALAAGSFRDGTRVAATPAARTANMLLGNRDRVLGELAGVTAYLDELAAALRAGDADRLTALQAAAGATRDLLSRPAYRTRVRDFPAGGDHTEEVAWLREVGAAGGHLGGCHVRADRVSYTAHLPEPSGA
ncbi:prephenate dehydrogenase/arogenate dehydrogenase family protein [Micromonospora sp. NPDC126480]|uniref:prephenate dehydrogenase n=1 Tax=Micromonospora sp. NPDC126480 TaxID=3155312 RepID=UPI0033287001